MNKIEGGLNIYKKYKVIPAHGNEFFKNCIVIESGSELSAAEIMALARANEAFEDNGDGEAGDDLCLVQFPGHEQEALDLDGLLARLGELNGQEGGE